MQERAKKVKNIVFTFSKDKLNEIQSYYKNHITKNPPNSLFLAKIGNTTISAYKSGKVMFQGMDAEKEAQKWKDKSEVNLSTHHSRTSVNDHTYRPPEDIFEKPHIGTDEAGTGDFFGPITVSAVYVSDTNISLLKKMGITDSKTLTDTRIKELAIEMVKLAIPYSLLTLPNTKYNKLQKKGWNQGKMKAVLHQHAIQKLYNKIENVPVYGTLIDQFCQPSSFIKHIRSENLALGEDTFFMTKAESYSTSVAAASIIARAKFVKEIDRLSEIYGVTIPKGASRKVDETAAYLIRKNGLEELHNTAKLHFSNTEKALQYLQKG